MHTGKLRKALSPSCHPAQGFVTLLTVPCVYGWRTRRRGRRLGAQASQGRCRDRTMVCDGKAVIGFAWLWMHPSAFVPCSHSGGTLWTWVHTLDVGAHFVPCSHSACTLWMHPSVFVLCSHSVFVPCIHISTYHICWADRHCWISQRKANVRCKKELVSASAILF